jgi:glycerophosphoryl diester phosphodiesterase
MPKNLKIPKIIGHRGAKGFAPENTLTSFRKAKELGARWVEFDVKETQDGALIIMHDDTLERTTNGKGKVASTNFLEIKKLDAGSWFHESFTNEKIPSFEETINLLKELNLGANIEIKPCPNKEEKTAILVAKVLKNLWPKELPRPIVSSFSMESLVAAKKVFPELIIGALFETLPIDWKIIAKSVQASTIHIDHENISNEKILEIINENYPVLAYTVNDTKRANELFKTGVTAIFTDFPWKE